MTANGHSRNNFPMTAAPATIPSHAPPGCELVVARVIDAPRDRVYRTWVTRLRHWWGPHGTTTTDCEMDLRPGGVFRTVMRAPDGTDHPTKGLFLEVVENERIVFTDAFETGWRPSPGIFFTAIITFEALPGDKTRCTVRAVHWTNEDREKHERIGFHQAWGECLDRLVTLATHP